MIVNIHNDTNMNIDFSPPHPMLPLPGPVCNGPGIRWGVINLIYIDIDMNINITLDNHFRDKSVHLVAGTLNLPNEKSYRFCKGIRV